MPVTLVIQGVTLPWLIQKVKPEDTHTAIPESQQERIIRQTISRNSLQFLAKTGLANARIANLSEHLTIDLCWLDRELVQTEDAESTTVTDFQCTYLVLLEQQRTWLGELNQQADFDEELIRKQLALIDLEELRLRGK